MLSNPGACAPPPSAPADSSSPSATSALKNTLALIAGWAELLAADPDLPPYVHAAARTIQARASEAAKLERAPHAPTAQAVAAQMDHLSRLLRDQ